MKRDRQRILISQPGFQYKDRDSVYLPYLHAILKSFANRDARLRESFEWSDPIYIFDDPVVYHEQIDRSPPSVLGLSCYIWNWTFQLSIAEHVKSRYPDCLIVMGGPQPDWQDPDFFRKYPFVDIVVRRDGEVPFREILKCRLDRTPDYSSIPGLFLQGDGHTRIDTGEPILNNDFAHDPYQECEELFLRVISAAKKTTALLETNRGCPYQCTFCDIGSAELSKIRQFPIDRVQREMEWLARHQVTNIFLADSNWGILPRDIELTRTLVELKRRYRFPRELEYDGSKMNLKANLEIAKLLWEVKLCTKVKVPWQHTDPDVLQAIRRIEPPLEKKAAVARQAQELGMRCRPELIMGMPGDTVQKFTAAVYQIFEFNLPDSLRANLMLILPNAPAAQASYRKRWQIDTVAKPVAPLHTGFGLEYERTQAKSYVEVVVGTSTYTREDWVEMMTFDSIAKVCHSIGSLTKYVAYYLRIRHGIMFKDFYDRLLKNFFANPEYPTAYLLVQKLRQMRHDYLETSALDFYPWPDDDLNYLLGGAEWLYASIMARFDSFYDEFNSWVSEQFSALSEPRELADVVIYQKEIMVSADYDARRGKRLSSSHDWPSFFDACFRALDASALAGLKPSPLTNGTELQVRDTHSSYLLQLPFDWATEQDPKRRRAIWLDRMVSRWNHWAMEGTRTFSRIEKVVLKTSDRELIS